MVNVIKFCVLLCVVIICGVLIYRDISHLAFPIDSVSKNEVLNKVSESSGDIVKITEEEGYQCYIAELDDGEVYEEFKSLMKDKGWNFKEIKLSKMIFESEKGEIGVSSRQWTNKYILFYFPKDI